MPGTSERLAGARRVSRRAIHGALIASVAAAAVTACGDGTGPSTDPGLELILRFDSLAAEAAASGSIERLIAISQVRLGLRVGAPVNSIRVQDGEHARTLSAIALQLEVRDSSVLEDRTMALTQLVAWEGARAERLAMVSLTGSADSVSLPLVPGTSTGHDSIGPVLAFPPLISFLEGTTVWRPSEGYVVLARRSLGASCRPVGQPPPAPPASCTHAEFRARFALELHEMTGLPFGTLPDESGTGRTVELASTQVTGVRLYTHCQQSCSLSWPAVARPEPPRARPAAEYRAPGARH